MWHSWQFFCEKCFIVAICLAWTTMKMMGRSLIYLHTSNSSWHWEMPQWSCVSLRQTPLRSIFQVYSYFHNAACLFDFTACTIWSESLSFHVYSFAPWGAHVYLPLGGVMWPGPPSLRAALPGVQGILYMCKVSSHGKITSAVCLPKQRLNLWSIK